ncbi:hypothetical protein evm_014669, partial [Chilo suppressalis]
MKVYHLVEGRNHEILFYDEDLEEHQPFPTLEDVLKTIDLHVGFNVELKWTMEMDDGTFELNNPFDMNTYVDKVLEVVLKNAGGRRIVFSCFNPDICTMVRYKQNKYPVMFLTVDYFKSTFGDIHLTLWDHTARGSCRLSAGRRRVSYTAEAVYAKCEGDALFLSLKA